MPHLFSVFESKGGIAIRAPVSSLADLVQLVPERPTAIVTCPGLGAATIEGIADPNVYPIRGQTVLVRAPWIRFGRTHSEMGVDGEWTYIIPRRSGDVSSSYYVCLQSRTFSSLFSCTVQVILGGTKNSNDFRPDPLKDITEDILVRCLKLCPELVTGSPEFASKTSTPSVGDLRHFVIEEGCGLRPARRGGIRLELDWLNVNPEGNIPVIHHYGCVLL